MSSSWPGFVGTVAFFESENQRPACFLYRDVLALEADMAKLKVEDAAIFPLTLFARRSHG
jgi:hypothetical protein